MAPIAGVILYLDLSNLLEKYNMCIVCEMRKEQKERIEAVKVNQAFTQSQTDNTNAITIATLAATMTDLQNIGQRERAEAVGKLIDGLLPKVNKPIPPNSVAMKRAEALIRQLPKSHVGRNSWLLNHGTKDEEAPVPPTKEEEIANLAKELSAQLGCTVKVFSFPEL